MRARFALVLLAMPCASSQAQESTAHFDAPVVVLSSLERFDTLVDLNGDGFMDAIGAWWSSDQFSQVDLSSYLNDGTGRLVFADRTGWHPGGNLTTPWSIATGDLTGDGLPEVVLAGDDHLRFLRVTPAGELLLTQEVDLPAHPYISGVQIADYDGDGSNDVAMVYDWQVSPGEIVIYSVDDATLVATELSRIATDMVRTQLTAAEVDGDGRPDLLLTDATRTTLVRVVGGVPQVLSTYVHGRSDPRPAFGDVDGDGDDDVVVFDVGTYVVLRRAGPSTWSLEPAGAGGPARFLRDVDLDGDLDGVCCGGGGGPVDTENLQLSTFRIALNDGAGDFAPALEMPGLGSQKLAGAADLDHDGDVDLVAGRCIYYAPSLLRRGGPPTVGTKTQTAGTIADWDGDGDPDYQPGLDGAFRNRGDGEAATTTPILCPPPPGSLFVGPGYPGDFDGDGDVDLVVSRVADPSGSFQAMSLLRNRGGGTYDDGGDATALGELIPPIGSTPLPERCVVGDPDGDLDLDLIVTTGAHHSRIWWNDGSGYFERGPALTDVNVRHVADVNGDGIVDLLGERDHWDSLLRGLVVLRGLGNGSFASPSPRHLAVRPTLDAWDLADVDGDGDLDACAPGPNNGMFVLYNTGQLDVGAGLFVSETIHEGALYPVTDVPRGVLCLDANGDGLLDLVGWSARYGDFDAPNGCLVFLRRSDGTYDAPICQVMQPTAKIDADGDGDVDLVAKNLYRNRSREGPSAGARVQTATGWPDATGAVPTLGASGPFRVGCSVEVRLTGAPPLATGRLIGAWIASSPPPFPSSGHGAARHHMITSLIPFATSGNAGLAASGGWQLPFVVPEYKAGRTYVYRADVDDETAPIGACARSNALYITYGP